MIAVQYKNLSFSNGYVTELLISKLYASFINVADTQCRNSRILKKITVAEKSFMKRLLGELKRQKIHIFAFVCLTNATVGRRKLPKLMGHNNSVQREFLREIVTFFRHP